MATNYEEPASMAFHNAYPQPSAWCLDSGCTSHMCKNRNLFTEIHEF